jgi:hypothetical protein
MKIIYRESGIWIVHSINVVIGEIHVHLQIGHLHYLRMPVAWSIEVVIDWNPRVNQNGLLHDGKVRAASAACG